MSPFTPQEFADRFRTARRVGALTGAGLSTAAGIPDFRGPKGLYVTRAYDPETVFEIGYFDRDPAPFYAFSRDFLGLLDTIQPTYTHQFLAEWEARGKIIGVATQNIDGLHARAGSRKVWPVHGDYETAHCRACDSAFELADYQPDVAAGKVPRCPCGGVIKPDVVFFGEAVRHLETSAREAASCDFYLVLGSSLLVHPAAGLPAYAGGDVWVVNRGEVPLRPGWRQTDADLDEFFRAVAECLAS